jgi:hypothetical protein
MERGVDFILIIVPDGSVFFIIIISTDHQLTKVMYGAVSAIIILAKALLCYYRTKTATTYYK